MQSKIEDNNNEGFETLREAFYQQWPIRPKKKVVFEEIVCSFRRLGFKTSQNWAS